MNVERASMPPPDVPEGMYPEHHGFDKEEAAARLRREVVVRLSLAELEHLATSPKEAASVQALIIKRGYAGLDVEIKPSLTWGVTVAGKLVELAQEGDIQQHREEALHRLNAEKKAAFKWGTGIVNRIVKGEKKLDSIANTIETKSGIVLVAHGLSYDLTAAFKHVNKYGLRRIVILGKNIDDGGAQTLRNYGLNVCRTGEEFAPHAKMLNPTFVDALKEHNAWLEERFKPFKSLMESVRSVKDAWETLPDGWQKGIGRGAKSGLILAGFAASYLAAHSPDIVREMQDITKPLFEQHDLSSTVPQTGFRVRSDDPLGRIAIVQKSPTTENRSSSRSGGFRVAS
ncbi:MAG TPA: hypothetical protein VGZ00_03610 [Candidatus Baltobacteraceae bacterium]|jgi:hypothetical protein|nr:hypothetical protein [Candidatus Baltobacteraceae bacterium]